MRIAAQQRDSSLDSEALTTLCGACGIERARRGGLEHRDERVLLTRQALIGKPQPTQVAGKLVVVRAERLPVLLAGGRRAVSAPLNALKARIHRLRQQPALVEPLEALTADKGQSQGHQQGSSHPSRTSMGGGLRLVACALLALGMPVFQGCRCDSEPGEAPSVSPPPAPNSLPAPPDSAREQERRRETHAAVERLRAETLRLSPLEQAPQRLAFAARELLELTSTAVRVWSIGANPAAHREFSLVEPGRLTVLPDGSLVALGAQETLRVELSNDKQQRWPRTIVFPGTELLAELRDSQHLLLLDGFRGELARYTLPLPSADPPTTSWLPELQDPQTSLRGAICGQLRDGALGCVASGQLYRWHPGSVPKPLGPCPAGASPFRIFGGKRADELLLARTDGRLDRISLIGKPRRLSSFELPFTPLDVSVGQSGVGVLRVEQAQAGPKHFSIEILDPKGTRVAKYPLDSGPAPGTTPDWTKSVMAGREVVIHPKLPFVAFRDGTRLRAYDWQLNRSLVDSGESAPP